MEERLTVVDGVDRAHELASLASPRGTLTAPDRGGSRTEPWYHVAKVVALPPLRFRRGAREDQDPARLVAILEQGAAKAQAIARENLALARERMGFLPRAGR